MNFNSAHSFQEQHLRSVATRLTTNKLSIKFLTLVVAIAFVVIHLSPSGQYQHAKEFVSAVKQKIENID